MTVLLDTNILIDFIAQREYYFDNARKIISLCVNDKIKGCIAAHSVMNTFYITRKDFSIEERRKILSGLCKILTVIGINYNKISNALDNENFSDIEDCLQMECAKELSADYIITRNIDDFVNSEIKPILPDDFLALMK